MDGWRVDIDHGILGMRNRIHYNEKRAKKISKKEKRLEKQNQKGKKKDQQQTISIDMRKIDQ